MKNAENNLNWRSFTQLTWRYKYCKHYVWLIRRMIAPIWNKRWRTKDTKNGDWRRNVKWRITSLNISYNFSNWRNVKFRGIILTSEFESVKSSKCNFNQSCTMRILSLNLTNLPTLIMNSRINMNLALISFYRNLNIISKHTNKVSSNSILIMSNRANF